MRAAEIAKKLSPAQKKAMAILSDPYAGSGSVSTSRVLFEKGLIRYLAYYAPLTPLGLEVRAHLLEEPA